MASNDWAALASAQAAAPAAEWEHLWRRAVFTDPWLVQWRHPAAMLARARALLAAAAARPPPEYPGVCRRGSSYCWQFYHEGSKRHGGGLATAREAALARDDELRKAGVDKQHLTFSYDGGVPVLNQARVPRGTAGVHFELRPAAGLPLARTLCCQNPHGCSRLAAWWYQAQLALCNLWCAPAGRALLVACPDALHATAATRM